MFKHLRSGLIGLLVSCAGLVQAGEPLKTYIFGNSLIHHLSDSDQTSMPHWLAWLADAAGQGVEIDGQWGFLRDFAATGMRPKWQFKAVPQGRGGDHDVIMLNPANFIQHRQPEQPYEGDNPGAVSPVQATLSLLDQITPKRLVIYQGWSEMRSIAGTFPPSRRDLARYYQYNQADYHHWYVAYRAAVQKARPELQVDLLPVGSVIMAMLHNGVLQDLAAPDVFADDAPHGTATLYFLAAAVSYAGLFQLPLPAELALPDSIHPTVRHRWTVIRETIHAQFGLEERRAGLGLDNPSLAMGLGELADWSPQQPFIDRMKMARTWVGHLPGRWGGRSSQQLSDGGYLDAAGWPWGIPPELRALEALLLTDQPAAALGLAGLYRVTYDGQGDLRITGRGRTVRRQKGEIWFSYVPGDGPVGLEIRATDPQGSGDYIRNIAVVHERHIALFEAGAIFNPDWIAHVADLRLLRFMDWMMTNGSEIASWQQRPRLSDYTYTRRGAPIAVMLALANQIAADPWLTLPHMADDDYIRRFAETVKAGLDPGRRVFVEYSNELWNFSFAQTHWARDMAKARWGQDAPGDAWIQFAGLRAAEVAGIWGEVFGKAADARLVRVIATHTGWKGLEVAMLSAPLAQADGLLPPVAAFDAYAVTGYFGLELGNGEGAEQTLKWLADSAAQARAEGLAKGYKRAKLAAYVDENRHRAAIPLAAKALRQGSLQVLTQEIFPYHAKVASDAGLQLLMYEGGSHVVGLAEYINNDALSEFFIELNYSDAMGLLYRDLLQGWRAAGGTLFNAFVDVGAPSKWGSWGALRYLEDDNPRHAVLQRFNQQVPAWWQSRGTGSFQHGGVFRGSRGSDLIKGSGGRDIMLAGDGDDVMLADGHGDLLHGGAGQDRAILPGQASDYRFEQLGGRVLARSAQHEVSLFAVETVEFSAAPGVIRAIATLF